MERYFEMLKCQKFEEFYNILQEGNKVCNLTTIVDREEVYIKHFLDSILAEKYFKKDGKVIEIGSGAGFPSIPLALVREDLQWTMVESIQKKVNFLQNAVQKLNLKAVVIENRAEILAQKPEYREQFDICTARAVAKMTTLVEYCLPFVKIGGYMVAYKSDIQQELDEAQYAIELLGAEISDIQEYILPKNMGNRKMILLKKIKNTPTQYPRGRGKERSKPLIKR